MLNLAALKSLALPKCLTSAHADTMRRRRAAAETIQHNQQAAARRSRNHTRRQESTAYRLQAAIDTAHHLRIPHTRLGLWLLYHFTPIPLRSRRIIWLQLRHLYPAAVLSTSAPHRKS